MYRATWGGVLHKVKEDLQKGRYVCFSGTPCQIEGLLTYVGEDYSNLFTVDVVCHGISSPLVWKKYLEFMRQNGIDADYAFFRKKHYGYKYSTMSLMHNKKEIYYNGVETDPMLRAYFDNICDMELCYSCPFKKRYRKSDITIWDCFAPSEYIKKFDDDKGTSKLLVHSTKGMQLVSNLIKKNYVRAFEVDPNLLVHDVREMVRSVNKKVERAQFLEDAATLSPKELFSKWYPISLKTRIKKTARLLLVKLGIYQTIRRLYWRIT